MLIEGIRNVATSYAPAVSQTAVAQAESASVPTSAGTQLPYISPIVQYDSDAGMAVLMFRDGESGSVETQYPSKHVVREYQLRGREGGSGGALPQTADVDVSAAVSTGKSASSSVVAVSAAPAVSAPSVSAPAASGGLAVNLVA
jgi:hypothetical protein